MFYLQRIFTYPFDRDGVLVISIDLYTNQVSIEINGNLRQKKIPPRTNTRTGAEVATADANIEIIMMFVNNLFHLRH